MTHQSMTAEPAVTKGTHMAGHPKSPGPTSLRLAANLRDVRKQRGMSTYAVARELKAIGWPILQSGLTRIEAGLRRVDADDLLALSAVLGCSPNRLLLPVITRDDPATPLAGNLAASQTAIWAWATGERPLTGKPGGGRRPSGPELALFRIANQPHHYVAEED
jgi:transcriptional regulator with XRE-family HTH domain